MRRRLGVAPAGALLLLALSACSGTEAPPATRDAKDVSHTAEVDIEPRAVAAIVAKALADQGPPSVVSVERDEAATTLYVDWSADAPVTSVRVSLSQAGRLINGCEKTTRECVGGSSEAGDFVVIESSASTVEGFRQSADGDSLHMTAYGKDGAFKAVRALVTDSDLSWTVPTSVNLDNRWQGRLSPARIVGSATKVRR